MTNQEILNKLNQIKNGRYVGITKEKELAEGITKVSNIVVRVGVNYAKMNSVQESGRVVQGLPWGNWLDNYSGKVIEHKGNLYLRVANSYNAKNNKCKYYKDGKEISRQEVVALIGEKKVAGSESDVYNIKFDNIIAIRV